VTVAGWLVPPAPVHVREKLVSPVSAPVFCEPLVANAPLQPPDAEHVVAPVEDHVSSLLPPAVTLVGEAVIEALGTGDAALPPPFPTPPPQDASAAAAPARRRQRIDRNIPSRS
jgi:hypothetical protein